MTLATSGPALHAPFAFYDPEASCWRTSQATFLSDSDRYSETWPRSGMTRAGYAYELPTPALPTAEPASSSLLPTPVTEPTTGNGHARNLGREVQLLPTPTADHSRGLPQPGTAFQSLPNAVIALLPTPGCAGGGKQIPEDAVWSGKAAYKPSGKKVQVHIDQIARLLPTPTAQDASGSRNSTHQRPTGSTAFIMDTLTDAATVLTGARTRALSPGGSASSGEQLPDLLSLLTEAAESD
jgi:hypothetical protein